MAATAGRRRQGARPDGVGKGITTLLAADEEDEISFRKKEIDENHDGGVVTQHLLSAVLVNIDAQ